MVKAKDGKGTSSLDIYSLVTCPGCAAPELRLYADGSLQYHIKPRKTKSHHKKVACRLSLTFIRKPASEPTPNVPVPFLAEPATVVCNACGRTVRTTSGGNMELHHTNISLFLVCSSGGTTNYKVPTPQNVPGGAAAPDAAAPQASVKKEHNAVNHPSHYTDGKIEVISFIDDKKLSFCLGNAVKYISRAGKKDAAKTAEDLEKSIWYIKHEIERLGAR